MIDDDVCSYSLDGVHHFGPRKWLVNKDPVTWVETYIEVIACRCKKRAPNDAPVLEGLKATAEERARQRSLSRVTKKVTEQGKLL